MAGISNGTIFRVPRHDNFTVMSNIHLRNAALSFKARGILSTILNFPPEWDYTLAGLAKCAKDSIDSTRTGVLELEKAGYLHRCRERKANGAFGKMEYQVYEDPTHNPHFTNAEAPSEDASNKVNDRTITKLKNDTFENDVNTQSQPELENPILGNPILENPMQINTQRNKHQISINQSIERSIEDGLIDGTATLPQSMVEILAAIGFNGGYAYASDNELSTDIQVNSLSTAALKACRIPHSFAQSKPITEQALRLVSCLEHYPVDDPFDPMNGIISALSSMATTESASYNQRTVTANQVIDKINERIAAEGCLMDWLTSFQAHWDKIMAERKDTVVHRSAYLKSCLWKWLEDSDAEIFANT